MSTLEEIFKKLGLNKENGLHKYGEDLSDYPSRIKISLESIKYDAIYGIENTPLILFRKLNYSEEVENEIEYLHKSVWNIGEIPILFILLPNEIRIYNGFVFDREKNEIWKKIDKNSELEEFSFMNIVSGNLWEKYENVFNKETRVQDYLLKNLKYTRKILNEDNLPFSIIHNLIGRLIFSRYLIDRGILKREFFKEKYKLDFEEIILDKEILYDYFKFLRNKFNGDMFPLIRDEKKAVTKRHLKVLYSLFKGRDVDTGQALLFDIYDFSIIPIELISNIYETFLDKRNINSNKSYYTPLFLVDYILNQTLDEILKDKHEGKCKILDPACGSGVFLVESIRRIIEKRIDVYKRPLKSSELKQIVKNSIFGVDQDEDAINISIFSIYLTLLDYQDLNDISKFKFPKLKNTNFFVSDFFDIENKFNKTISNFDLIIGNPPWGNFKGLHIQYCEKNHIPISSNQIAQSFLVRVKDFIKEDTKIALIVTSKILYNVKAGNFRTYFLNNFFIDKIFEFSAVRRKIFQNAIGPGAIIFYRFSNSKNTKDNIVEHTSLKPNRFFDLFKAIVIEKYDIKYIQQEYFLNYDWLWKVCLYGSILDFNFIKRLKDNYTTINDIINEKKSLKSGVGIVVGGDGKPKDISYLLGTPYLDLKKNMLKRYFIDHDKKSSWNISKAQRINPELFDPPNILIRKSLDKDFKVVAAFSEHKIVYKDYVGAIKGSDEDKTLLKNILGLLNSQLFTYFILLTGSSSGIERGNAYNEEKFAFPVPHLALKNNKISKKVETLEKLYKELYQDTNSHNMALDVEKELNNYIFNLYELDNIEKELIDYNINVSIPLIKGFKIPFDAPTKDQLIKYAQIFVEHFKHVFKGPEFFFIEIYSTEYFSAMNFKVVSEKPEKSIVFPKNKDINRLINRFGIISIEKINELYIQRDVKGFEKTSFFVIKPNEYKNWHEAVARLDLSEFIDAMIQTSLKKTGDVP